MKTFLTIGILLLCINIFGQDCFKIGSSQNTVRSIQGTPSSINDFDFLVIWSYGASSVTFENGKVKSYNNLSNNLKICESKDNSSLFNNSGCFEIGSSQNTVRNIQGTPSSINDFDFLVIWSYGASSVTFENGKVKSYNNLSKNLKICETDNYQNYTNQNNSRKQTQTTTNKIDTKFGIRDILLESTFSSIRNKYTLTYEKIYSSDKYDSYSIENFDRFLGDDIIITNINLDFIDNELYRINLSIDCDKAVTRLTELIEESYGELEEDTESHEYFIKGNKAALYYSVRGKQLSNGYIKSYANVSILSLRLRKKFLGTTGF